MHFMNDLSKSNTAKYSCEQKQENEMCDLGIDNTHSFGLVGRNCCKDLRCLIWYWWTGKEKNRWEVFGFNTMRSPQLPTGVCYQVLPLCKAGQKCNTTFRLQAHKKHAQPKNYIEWMHRVYMRKVLMWKYQTQRLSTAQWGRKSNVQETVKGQNKTVSIMENQHKTWDEIMQ